MKRYGYLLWGIPAGLTGALAGSLILWGAWQLPTLGLLLTRVSLFRGFASLLILGALGGLLYAAVVGRRRLRLHSTILAGAILGVLLWVIGPLVLVPLLLGFPPLAAGPLDNWMPLVAFTFYGVIAALLYSRFTVQSPARIYYAAGLLLIAALLTPFLLRAAVSTDPGALELPPGYRAEVVAKGFTYPTSLALDRSGDIYVAESGYTYGPKETEARVLRVSPSGTIHVVAGGFNGPLNGLALREGKLYISHRGKISLFDLESEEREDLVTGLPSLGDHQNNDLVFGDDGALYFGQGTATNAGVVGSDNFVYAWTDRYPEFHDFPSRKFTLTGENYEALDLSTPEPADKKSTGAFAPYGVTRRKGEILKAVVPASGAIHRIDLEHKTLGVYADGLRNPYGLAMDAAGGLYATNLGYDDRGSRAVKNSPDWVVKVKKGAWYGWPDYAGQLPLTEPLFNSDRGINRRPLIVDPPPVESPLATLPPHYSPMKLACAPEQFGEKGLMVAIFGDAQPLTENLKDLVPTGVINVDPETGKYSWFVKNKLQERAGRSGGGFKRLIDVKFSTDGKALYLLDFGVVEFTGMAPNAIPNSGVLWKISPAG
jgi:glucose/arabinose dehydrogenase